MSKKHIKLVQLLRDRTAGGFLNWEETADEGVYQVAFSDYGIRISREWNREDKSFEYTTSIYNADGVLIEEIEDRMIFDMNPDAEGYEMMEETYETARRIAMGVEQALDALLSRLQDDGLPF